MKAKGIMIALLAGCILTGCASKSEDKNNEKASATDATATLENSENISEEADTSNDDNDVVDDIDDEDEIIENNNTDKTINYNITSGMYSKDIAIKLVGNEEVSEIYYTLDGSKPDSTSEKYSGEIKLSCGSKDFPLAYCIRAVALLKDGSMSDIMSEEYLIGENIEERFTTPVFMLWGNPAELTEKPDGIFYGQNAKKTGRDSEREVFVSAFTNSGKVLFDQNAGVRVSGKASRDCSIKSLKLFARNEYGKKRFNIEDSLGEKDSAGTAITKYKKLVLRNFGNDFQFAFIRDEFCQRLAKEAGLVDYEATTPAVAYLNGEYYGFYYLHDNYCDGYFKEKYKKPDEDMKGEFAVIEGGDSFKSGTDDKKPDSYNPYAVEYQQKYDEFANMDLKKDANYELLTEFMDVNNYLDYFAFNIYINNWDWPQNNYKCYRYYADDNTDYGDGVYDGRWRYLPHDMDYTYGIYGQDRSSYNYDNLKLILKKGDERYAPLFAKLMEREDCRTYFLNKINEFMDSVFTDDFSKKILTEMCEERNSELSYLYKHIEQLKRSGDDSLWSSYSDVSRREREIEIFISMRRKYMEKYLSILEK